jgi:GNAT superfamily N-acetyltransferase
MTVELGYAETDKQIADTFEVMRQLRPHLVESEYVQSIRSLMASEGLKLLSLSTHGHVKAVATYRIMRMLYCGALLYVDDLVVDEQSRSGGYGRRILERLKEEAHAVGCSEIQLISRVTREQAHRFYFREGFGIECFHFRRKC